MQKRGMITRIVAIVLAAIMIISVGAAAISAFAAGVGEVPVTGQSTDNTKWIVVMIVVAVVAIVACVLIPKAKKK